MRNAPAVRRCGRGWGELHAAYDRARADAQAAQDTAVDSEAAARNRSLGLATRCKFSRGGSKRPTGRFSSQAMRSWRTEFIGSRIVPV